MAEHPLWFARLRPFLLLAGMLGLLCIHTATASAADQFTPTVSAEIVPALAADPLRLKVTVTPNGGTWIYSTTQPPGGPVPTSFQLAKDLPLTIAGPAQASVAPKVETTAEFGNGEIKVEKHFDAVTWTVPLTVATNADAALTEMTGTVKVQVCNHDFCRIEKLPFSANLAPGCLADAYAKQVAALPAEPTEVVALALAPPKAAAKPASGPVAVSAMLVAATATEPAKLLVTVSPTEGHWVYSTTQPPGGPLKTKISVEAGQVAELAGDPAPNHPPKISKTPEFDVPVEKYAEAVTWSIPLKVAEGKTLDQQTINGAVKVLVCNDNFCKPETIKFTAVLGQEPTATGATATESSFSNPKLVAMIFLAFLGGIVLNVMPCVLPVLALKIQSFIAQSGESRLRIFSLNVAYTLGILVVFWILAALACGVSLGLTSSNLSWGEQFNNPRFTIPLACIVWVMALSFVGVWEIPIPGFAMSSTAHSMASKEGLLGAFAKGIVGTLLATPCGGGGVGVVFGFTKDAPPYVVFTAFTAIGLGMASPYLVLGLFPGLLKALPKPGEWMDTLKQFMGFLLLGTVVFIVSFVPQYVIPTFGLLIALWAACWWIGKIPLGADAGQTFRAWATAVSLATLVGTGLFGVLYAPTPPDAQLAWEPFSRAKLEQYQAEGRPVLVDFTADWCINCKVLEKFVLNTAVTKNAVLEKNVVTMVADWSDEGEDLKRELNSLGANSIPVTAIYPADRTKKPIVLIDMYTRQTLLDALQQAGPSTLAWEPFSAAKLAQYQAEGRTVLVTFMADWDMNGKILEKFVLNTAVTKNAVREKNVVTMVADWTDEDEGIKRELNSLGANSVPVTAIYPADHMKKPIVLIDMFTRQRLLEALEEASPGPAGAAPVVATPANAAHLPVAHAVR